MFENTVVFERRGTRDASIQITIHQFHIPEPEWKAACSALLAFKQWACSTIPTVYRPGHYNGAGYSTAAIVQHSSLWEFFKKVEFNGYIQNLE